MGPTPFYGATAEKPLQKADFAMKQTNICRLSGDINSATIFTQKYTLACLYTSGGLINISASVRNTWKVREKSEFDEEWRVAIGQPV